ncbi:hypothetical protein H696_05423 [Fonticula alba]|uniref:Uncharacterized protein n=1 Tax=Fonticula alba TaxID=691883 RepID=A0A058Z160_FONAL|nr:hypothetical protein H696_05423 [Fonticula alba]KCV67965.1 hypothetical protein H696_05423 [Fonticula alba]|eukprot:XP_009497532.1 hypothetical protein H696_05423 [Fonticula alba]
MDAILDRVDFDQDQPLLLLHVIPLAFPALLTAAPPHAGHRALLKLLGHADSLAHLSELAHIARAVARPAHVAGSGDSPFPGVDALNGFLAMCIFGPAGMDLVLHPETRVIDCDFDPGPAFAEWDDDSAEAHAHREHPATSHGHRTRDCEDHASQAESHGDLGGPCSRDACPAVGMRQGQHLDAGGDLAGGHEAGHSEVRDSDESSIADQHSDQHSDQDSDEDDPLPAMPPVVHFSMGNAQGDGAPKRLDPILQDLLATGRHTLPAGLPFDTNYPQLLWFLARWADNRDLLNIFQAFQEAGCCSTPVHLLQMLEFATSRAAALLTMLLEPALAVVGQSAILDGTDADSLPLVHGHVLVSGTILLKWLQFACDAPLDLPPPPAGAALAGMGTLLPRVLAVALTVLDAYHDVGPTAIYRQKMIVKRLLLMTSHLIATAAAYLRRWPCSSGDAPLPRMRDPSAASWAPLLLAYWTHLAPVMNAAAPVHRQALSHIIHIVVALPEDGPLGPSAGPLQQMLLLLPADETPSPGVSPIGALFGPPAENYPTLVFDRLADGRQPAPTRDTLHRDLLRAQALPRHPAASRARTASG